MYTRGSQTYFRPRSTENVFSFKDRLFFSLLFTDDA